VVGVGHSGHPKLRDYRNNFAGRLNSYFAKPAIISAESSSPCAPESIRCLLNNMELGAFTRGSVQDVSTSHRVDPPSPRPEEAVRRLKAGLPRAAASIPVLQVEEERWEGDRLVFRVRALGQAASGHLDVAEDHARLEVTLPWLLQRFAKAAQVAIRNRGNLLLTKRS
jgi:hypothetical protein